MAVELAALEGERREGLAAEFALVGDGLEGGGCLRTLWGGPKETPALEEEDADLEEDLEGITILRT